MRLRHFLTCLGLAVAVGASTRAEESEREQNFWPVRVAQRDAHGVVQSWHGAGPLLFHQPQEDGVDASGFRPFYLRKLNAPEAKAETSFIYPLFVYRSDGESYRWSILQLINFGRPRAGEPTTERNDAAFDVWPFYFSRRTDSPETTYHALFPIYGTIKNRLFFDRISWALFPLYFRTEKHGVVTNSYPWPFLRTVHGADNTGFALWPLFGWRRQPGVYHNEFYLWPLIYRNVSRVNEPVPKESFGILPFYASEHSAEAEGKSYLDRKSVV